MRKILYITGTRADYGPARRLLKLIHDHAYFELGILVTGMHLDPTHGETWTEIEEDGLNIVEKVAGRLVGDSLSYMSASIGLYLYGMSFAVERYCPDIVLVLGDRGEQLTGAMAGAFQNITVVHLAGGTISGSIDDSIRHAITKFAHYHFPGFEEASKRIIQMGEQPDHVKVVGLPGGDIKSDVTYTKKQICEKYKIPEEEPYILVIQHAVTQSQSESAKQIIETLEAVASLKFAVFLANPNDDAGGMEILTKMNEYAAKYTCLKILKPPKSRELFASVMAHADVLVGNSSSGIVEAMSVQTPVVNIGDRQKGRESLSFLLNVDYKKEEIVKAIKKALDDLDYFERFKSFSSSGIISNTEELIINELEIMDLSLSMKPKFFHEFNHGE